MVAHHAAGALEALAEQPFGLGAQLTQGGVAPAVLGGGPALDADDAESVEREVGEERCAFDEQPGAPERLFPQSLGPSLVGGWRNSESAASSEARTRSGQLAIAPQRGTSPQLPIRHWMWGRERPVSHSLSYGVVS